MSLYVRNPRTSILGLLLYIYRQVYLLPTFFLYVSNTTLAY